MQLGEIKKLADLARIDMSEKEMIGMAKDFDSILAYVSQVQEITKLISDDSTKKQNSNFSFGLKNIMREDVATPNPEIFSDKIIKEMPKKDSRFLKVKKIL